MTDPLDLDALEAAEKAATPGPWRLNERRIESADVYLCEMLGSITNPKVAADAEFIVFLRNNARALIAEVRRLREFVASHYSDKDLERQIHEGVERDLKARLQIDDLARQVARLEGMLGRKT